MCLTMGGEPAGGPALPRGTVGYWPASSFGMRRQHFTSLVYGSWAADADHDAARHRRWVSDLSARLAPLALPGGYANLLAPDAHKQIAAAYGGNARRLSELKRKYDPENVFSSAIPLPS